MCYRSTISQLLIIKPLISSTNIKLTLIKVRKFFYYIHPYYHYALQNGRRKRKYSSETYTVYCKLSDFYDMLLQKRTQQCSLIIIIPSCRRLKIIIISKRVVCVSSLFLQLLCWFPGQNCPPLQPSKRTRLQPTQPRPPPLQGNPGRLGILLEKSLATVSSMNASFA